MDSNKIEVRDLRRGGWAWFDTTLIRRDGPTIGVYGIATYSALAALADGGTVAGDKFPLSIPDIAKAIGCSDGMVRKSLRQLESLGWIRIEYRKITLDDGKVINDTNIYYLLNTPQQGIAANTVQNAVAAPAPAVGPAKPDQPPVTTVVNIHMVNGQRPDYDIYIGRAGRGIKGSDWANPFKESDEQSREQVIGQYRDYLLNYRPDLLQKIPTLVGKRLGCWCAPKPCHGDVLVALANQYQAGTWQPPDVSQLQAFEAPALFSVSQIKALKFTKTQWETMRENEQRGRNRRSVIEHCEAKLNAHPLEPRFDEMMKALDACTIQSIDDPGMAKIFATVIRTSLWASRAEAYTPEDLLNYAREKGKIQNVYWLAGELSQWRQAKKEAKDEKPKASDEDLLRKLGRKSLPSDDYILAGV